jgi:hypothetical protein
MIRIRRTFIAVLSATALTASMGASPVPASPTATASACTYSVWKITKRQNVSCRKAKRVLKNDKRISGEGDGHPGWKCSYGQTIFPEGKCHKGTSASFKYSKK